MPFSFSVKENWLFHCPKGRNRTQLLNDGRQIFKDVIDFSIRCIPGQRETDGAMREGEGNAHSAQHMRRFQTAGGAGRTGASTDAELIHEQQDRLALNILKRDIGRIRQTVLHISIHDGIGNSRQKAFFQLIAEGGHSRVFIRHVVHGQFTCGTEAYDVRRVFRAGATPPFLMPAAKKRDEPRSLADIQHSDPLGGVELVPRKI